MRIRSKSWLRTLIKLVRRGLASFHSLRRLDGDSRDCVVA